MKRTEDPYGATPPPWRGWPSAETSRRRWRIALLVPAAGVVGCGLSLLVAGAFALLLVVSRLSVPVPDGEPLALSRSEVTGTWVDERGGRLTLRQDGTFGSDGVCGDFDDNDDDRAEDVTAPAPGEGGWEHDETGDDIDTGAPVSTVHLTFAPSGIWARYEARGTSKDPVLWTYVGDPDEGRLCVLEKAGSASTDTPGADDGILRADTGSRQ
ncbi:hypothetical protein [Streptomyces scabiei]|uniref:hypothetical protein n=1 Tax=Streptomyces scabiei TaxID=1930 RepID=UPI0007C76FE9|nr:hypothetical protein [Streptomyces scabiei]